MTILFCGKFDPDYNRTRVIIEGLKQHGLEVLIYNYPRKRKADKSQLKDLISQSDFIFLPSFTHRDVPFIRRMTDKLIVFDPLISRYLSKVFDYRAVSKNSPRAYKNLLKDKRGLKAADLILADTNVHKNYFIEKFGSDGSRIEVIPIGFIRDDFFPIKKEKENDILTVGFYGSFIPLHGIDIILKAASLLKEDSSVRFCLIGDGILMNDMKKLAGTLELKNVEFTGWKKYEELNEEINNFDITLGIFGSSRKAGMVVPNKMFHYAGCRKAMISMESAGIKEIFTDKMDVFLCENNARDLAEAIKTLKNKELRDSLASEAYRLVTEKYNEHQIAGKILDFVKPYL